MFVAGIFILHFSTTVSSSLIKKYTFLLRLHEQGPLSYNEAIFVHSYEYYDLLILMHLRAVLPQNAFEMRMVQKPVKINHIEDHE